MRCLIIKNDGIGDLVLASGIIAEISKHFNGNLDLITCEQNREIADMLIGVRRKYYVSRDDIQFFKFRGYNRLGLFIPRIKNKDKIVVNQLKSKKYDIAICLRRFIRQSSLILMHYVDADEKYCAWQYPTNATYKMARKYSNRWQHYNGDLTVLPEITYYKNFLETELNINIDPYPRLNFNMRTESIPAKQKLGLILGGTGKTWPYGYWASIISKLADNGWDITLYGGKDLIDLGDFLTNNGGCCKSNIGKMSISASVSDLSNVSAIIGNDTGLSHLASLVVPKCLIILGGGAFKRFFPWPNSTNQYVVIHALECFDCEWQCKYPENYCLTMINPEDVFNAFQEMMGNHKKCCIHNTNTQQQSYQIWWRNEHTPSIVKRFEDI